MRRRQSSMNASPAMSIFQPRADLLKHPQSHGRRTFPLLSKGGRERFSWQKRQNDVRPPLPFSIPVARHKVVVSHLHKAWCFAEEAGLELLAFLRAHLCGERKKREGDRPVRG